MNDKYFVCKKSDLRELFKRFNNPMDEALLREVTDLELPDAEVIRQQDITAAPIFHHYSSGINTLIELADSFAIPVNRLRLREIADHFHEAAMAAEQADHKIPD